MPFGEDGIDVDVAPDHRAGSGRCCGGGGFLLPPLRESSETRRNSSGSDLRVQQLTPDALWGCLGNIRARSTEPLLFLKVHRFPTVDCRARHRSHRGRTPPGRQGANGRSRYLAARRSTSSPRSAGNGVTLGKIIEMALGDAYRFCWSRA